MVRANTEKMLGANLPAKFVEDFWIKAAPAGTSKNLVVKAMSLVWLDLTEKLRRENLYPVKDDKKLSEVIEEIVDGKIKNACAVLLKKLSPDIPEQELQQMILKILEDAQAIPVEKQHERKANPLKAG